MKVSVLSHSAIAPRRGEGSSNGDSLELYQPTDCLHARPPNATTTTHDKLHNGVQHRAVALLPTAAGQGRNYRQGYDVNQSGAAGMCLLNVLDPPKFDLESYIANYTGMAVAMTMAHSARTHFCWQDIHESIVSTTLALTRHTSPSTHTASPLRRPRRARMSGCTQDSFRIFAV